MLSVMLRNSFLTFFMIISSLSSSAQDLLTLEEAVRVALENNYSIQIVRNNQRIADNNNSFGNYGFLPSVDAGISDQENRNSQETVRSDGTVREGDGLKSDNLSADIRLNWTIFDGFRMFVTRDRLAQEESVAQLETAAAVANLVAIVTSVYYGIVQQEKLAEVTRQSMELSRRRKQISDDKIRIGSGSRLMLLQSQVDFNADSAVLIKRLVDSEKAKAQLNRLINRDIRTDFSVVDDVVIDNQIGYDQLLTLMKAQNPNLQVAQINRKIADLEVKGFKSQYYPQLDVFAAYEYSKTNFPAGFSFNQNSTRNGSLFGFRVSWNLFNGTYISPNLQSAKIQVVTSELQYKDNEQLLSGELYEAFKDYEANLKLVRLETNNLELAKENVRIALEQYQLGVINDIDLRAIQLKQVESETNLLVSQFLAKQSEIQLKLISGTLTVN